MSEFVLIETPYKFYKWLKEQKITRSIFRVQNHHTYRPDYSNFTGENHKRLHNGMRNFHVDVRSFSDIAQHFTTYPDGSIAIGRDINVIPAGIKGANTGSICIEHIGNFDIGEDEMNDRHKNFIVMYNAILLNHFKIEANDTSLIYHHWFSSKSCAGTNFFGGNTVEAANKYFIPLIDKEMKCKDWK